jgi:hypothetical protein
MIKIVIIIVLKPDFGVACPDHGSERSTRVYPSQCMNKKKDIIIILKPDSGINPKQGSGQDSGGSTRPTQIFFKK